MNELFGYKIFLEKSMDRIMRLINMTKDSQNRGELLNYHF